jgi:hypothetical protein
MLGDAVGFLSSDSRRLIHYCISVDDGAEWRRDLQAEVREFIVQHVAEELFFRCTALWGCLLMRSVDQVPDWG